MYKVIAPVLALLIYGAPASAASFQYDVLLGHRDPDRKFYYTAKGVMDAESQGVVNGVETWKITAATGELFDAYFDQRSTVADVQFAYGIATPAIPTFTTTNGTLSAAYFRLESDRDYLNVQGTVAGGLRGGWGEFLGPVSLSITPLTAAVPEPASWGMMLIGFGAVGAALRRRTAVRIAMT